MPELNPIEPPRVRVLVVEDNDDDQRLLLAQLNRANFQDRVKFVNSGGEALELLTKENEEVSASEVFMIFLDLSLPGMNGVEFLRKIRASPGTSHLAVVVMTGSLNPVDREECEGLQVMGYLAKPVTFQMFAGALASAFHRPRPKLADGQG